MASLTAGTFLMLGSGDSTVTYTKLCDITEFPDLGSAPEAVDVTTLSDYMHKYIPGLIDTGSMEFSAFLEATDFQTIQGYAGAEKKLAVWFGGTRDTTTGTITPTGDIMKIAFDGYIDIIVTGGGVDDVIGVTIVVTPSSAFTYTFA